MHDHAVCRTALATLDQWFNFNLIYTCSNKHYQQNGKAGCHLLEYKSSFIKHMTTRWKLSWPWHRCSVCTAFCLPQRKSPDSCTWLSSHSAAPPQWASWGRPWRCNPSGRLWPTSRWKPSTWCGRAPPCKEEISGVLHRKETNLMKASPGNCSMGLAFW